MKKQFYWPGYAQDIQHWCQTCATCVERITAAPKNQALLRMQTTEVGCPMQVVAVNIVGPFPENQAGNSYILVAGDYFSKWMEAYPISNQEASQKPFDKLFCRLSTPEQLQLDQGKQFESDLLKEICTILNIAKTRMTAYHPQYDSLVKRFNQTLLSMLATTVVDHPFDWEEALPKMCMAYNSSGHPTTGYISFFLYVCEAWLPIHIVYGEPVQEQHDDVACSTYASSNMKKSLE